MTATFKVLDDTTVVKQYELEYNSAEELHELFQEARKVWDEYIVEAHTQLAIMSYSCTYAEQVKAELNK